MLDITAHENMKLRGLFQIFMGRSLCLNVRGTDLENHSSHWPYHDQTFMAKQWSH